MKIADVYTEVQAYAPVALAEHWDHVGLLVGRPEAEVSRVLCALDITREVIEEAAAWGAQMIIAHHPLFFGGLPTLTPGEFSRENALLLAENGIAGICMHTNLDATEGGVNDALTQALGLAQVERLSANGCSRVGCAEVKSVKSYAAHCKAALGCGVVRFFDAGRPVSKVAIASGSGWDNFPDVLRCGADTFVTGDVKHSSFLEARHHGVNVLDCGHFATENVVFPPLMAYLSEKFPALEIKLSAVQGEPYQCL